MPFGGYSDFSSCVASNKDKRDPEAYCGHIKHQVEGKKEIPDCLYCHNTLYKSELKMLETKKAILTIGKALAKAGYTEGGPENPMPPFPSARAPPGTAEGQAQAQPQPQQAQPQQEAGIPPSAGAQATMGTESAGMGGMGAGSAMTPQEANPQGAAQAAQQQIAAPQTVVGNPAEHVPGIVQALDNARKYLIEGAQRWQAIGMGDKAQELDKLITQLTQLHGDASTFQNTFAQGATGTAPAPGKGELPAPVPSPTLAQGM